MSAPSSPPSEPTIDSADRLNVEEVAEALSLVNAVTEADDVSPLSEHVLLHLRHGGDDGDCHIRVRIDCQLVGYAHLDLTDPVAGPCAELAVAPSFRRRGIGHLLVDKLTELSPRGHLRLWAHGGHSDAAHLARAHHFNQARELWQMRRSLFANLPNARFPEGIVLRTFEPGRDNDAWLAVNAEAFADLPDQGNWQADDLTNRLAEPWCDLNGFLVAEDAEDGRLVGFHWTKVHGAHPGNGTDGHGHEAIGEVFVIAVANHWRGTGLGRALLLAGLSHLRTCGLSAAMLYVDAVNSGAVALYESLGFARWDTDILFSR